MHGFYEEILQKLDRGPKWVQLEEDFFWISTGVDHFNSPVNCSMISTGSLLAIHINLLDFTSLSSPVILWKKIGQTATNCNRRFFNGFRLCNVSLLTYRKSQKIPLREVFTKRDLLWSSETRFMSPWERGWPKRFFYKACEKIFNLVKCNEISSLHVQF